MKSKSEFKPCEIMLLVQVNTLEEFSKIRIFFEGLGKDFEQIFQGSSLKQDEMERVRKNANAQVP